MRDFEQTAQGQWIIYKTSPYSARTKHSPPPPFQNSPSFRAIWNDQGSAICAWRHITDGIDWEADWGTYSVLLATPVLHQGVHPTETMRSESWVKSRELSIVIGFETVDYVESPLGIHQPENRWIQRPFICVDKPTKLMSFLIQRSGDPLRLEGCIPCKTKLKYK